jgi:hypothetical protein
MPAGIQPRLFAAFGLELIDNKHDHQVTIYATIAPSTPQALAEIIAASEPPAAPAEPAAVGHFPTTPQNVMVAPTTTNACPRFPGTRWLTHPGCPGHRPAPRTPHCAGYTPPVR